MTEIELLIYKFGLWLYCATSGRNSNYWPTKYGRPVGAAIMRAMVTRKQKRTGK